MESRLWQEFGNWFLRRISEFLDLFGKSPAARYGAIAALILLGAVIVLRLAFAAGSARDVTRLTRDTARFAGRAEPWAEAERLAARGEFTEAAHALFAALVSSLAARGELRLHASKTSGDYARELRRAGSLSQIGFQAFRRRYDHVIYGERQCSADEYHALLGDALPFQHRNRAA